LAYFSHFFSFVFFVSLDQVVLSWPCSSTG
jgi:hypothetical protein